MDHVETKFRITPTHHAAVSHILNQASDGLDTRIRFTEDAPEKGFLMMTGLAMQPGQEDKAPEVEAVLRNAGLLIEEAVPEM